jgi:apolipoprotein N-acyltransferase
MEGFLVVPSLTRDIPLTMRVLLASAAGGLTVLAFAPFSVFVVAFLSLPLLYELLVRSTAREGFLVGWGFGIGLMGFGVYWIRISLNEYGNMAPWLAYLMTFLLVASMALYYGAAGALASGLKTGPSWSGPLLAFPAVWVLTEWLRGWLFSGFPWLTIGYSQIDSPLGGFAPIAGVYGVSLAVALCAGLLWALVRLQGRARYAALSGLVLILLTGAVLGRVEWTEPDGEGFFATVVQGNIPQDLKWDPDLRIPSLRTYLKYTRENWGSDLIVWPETAVPDYLHRVRDPFIRPLAQEAREHGAEMVIGVPIMDLEARAYFNALISIGTAEDVYRKRHLVPFGEFIPFRDWLGPFAEVFEVPMSDFSVGTALRPLLRVGEHLAGVSICYEDAFPDEVRQAMPEASYLINVSNDAWFGDSLAPRQHLEMARMRALENGRWLLRSTNTGISAILDHRGDVVGVVPPFERGAFTAEVQPRRGATPFVHLGNSFAIGVAFLMLAVCVSFVPRRQMREAISQT